ncbi:hypothetical protein [Kitasatospora herbaricolor]|uniref:DUF402 domain-containing protein n=1 Tax=Kitasatospora herbaricolor TaxID=68217 RepID=A0ABZ1W6N9_9ACTN|nr:hypothetical protein [Kitasatospora herbaricolor]
MDIVPAPTDQPSCTGNTPVPDRLGPLVRVEGRWFIGDHERKAHIALLPQGFEHRVAGHEPHLVTWDRLMDLTVAVTSNRFFSTPVGGLLTKYDGITVHGSTLRATVRHPYDVWVPRFIHHRCWYPVNEILALDALLSTTVELGRAERLGDDSWLRSAVALVTSGRHVRKGWRGYELSEALTDLITREG